MARLKLVGQSARAMAIGQRGGRRQGPPSAMRAAGAWASEASFGWTPPMDITDSNGAIRIAIDLPGLAPEAITIELAGALLVVRGERTTAPSANVGAPYQGERQFGAFSQAVYFADPPEPDAVRAELSRGVLTITVPRPPGPGERVQIAVVEKLT
ncbi:Hsp20/alpha crystallin family protein [Arsenicitalea aurantiaca]|uniref:Hsp20/alpha crystallin family protein n=1 Tax=Arsenicitalea aurantiaca TaxID=1783274 RepID=A0A433XAZ4_9HYPH|nr:Hsp20/alpha crystallin family protein [Arsenicitalea aurantiaca]RUT31249.1 Hsp20/alpha crystallin family protein [Arsenicitalea aurantiaca]